MKIKHILVAGILGVTLLNTSSLRAADKTTAPVVIPPGDSGMMRDLKNAPQPVKDLIINFDATRDKYLKDQKALLTSLKTATDKQQIRADLKANRDAFLTELKTFRTDLRADLKDLKGKIKQQEFKRIIDAARDASTKAAPRKGQQ